jgi:hypothetical protein
MHENICVHGRERGDDRRDLPPARRDSARDRIGCIARKILSPRQLRERLDERFRVLTGGSRDVLPRQQTLRAMIDWSHDLLDERERVLFRRLGIFVSGFTLEGAVAVGSGEDSTSSTSSTCWRRWSISRWCLPNRTVTRYATGCSNRRAPMPWRNSTMRASAISLRGRHLRYLRDRFARSVERRERTARTGDLLAALQTELEDVRSALDGALGRSEVIDGGELLANFDTSWRPSDSKRKASHGARRISRRFPRTSRGCAARLTTALSFLVAAFPETRCAHLSWRPRRSSMRGPAATPCRCLGAGANTRLRRRSSIGLTTRRRRWRKPKRCRRPRLTFALTCS